VFNILKRTKPVVIKAYIPNYHPGRFFEPTTAKKYLPKWFKNLKPTKFNWETGKVDNPSIKICPGFNDLFDKSIALPMWYDLAFKYSEEEGQYSSINSESEFFKTDLGHHPSDQWKGWVDDKLYYNVKIFSPWLFECNESISFYQTDNMFINPFSKFNIVSGVLDFKYQHQTNINMMVKRENIEHMFKIGEPICFFIPLTERDVKIEVIELSKQDHIDIMNRSVRGSFSASYYKIKRKIIKDKDEQKCPFGFGEK
jgi:hypothetical protein